MKKILLLIIIPIIYWSCSTEDYKDSINSEASDFSDSYIVLQERSSSLPSKWERPIRNRIKQIKGANDFMPDDYVGYSYKVLGGNGIVGDQENVGRKVINTDKILQDASFKTIIKNVGCNISFNESFSYFNSDMYYEKTKTTKKFNSGFEFNAFGFKLGHTNTIKKIYTNELTDLAEHIYGETNAGMITGMHSINTTTSSFVRISTDFLDPIFIEDLYFSPMSEIVDQYGEFVLTNYLSGGRAHASYMGSYTDLLTSESAEKYMDYTINASYKWEKKSSTPPSGDETKATESTSGEAGVNVGWGKDYEKINKSQTKIKQLYFTFKAIGGAGVTSTITSPSKIEETSVNLNDWIKSLDTPKNQKLIEIGEGGLTGISCFILEENLKKRFQEIHLDLCSNKEFFVPHIEIVRVPVRVSNDGVQLYDIVPVLYTRYGDLFLLQENNVNNLSDADLLVNNNQTTFNSKSIAIAAKKAQIYQGLEITANFKKIINPRFNRPLNFRLSGINESTMYKFYNEDSDVWYMYDTKSKIAYAFYLDEYILENYGLSEWFENLPEKSIKMISLVRNFRIFGL